jgi:hypothetical protein
VAARLSTGAVPFAPGRRVLRGNPDEAITRKERSYGQARPARHPQAARGDRGARRARLRCSPEPQDALWATDGDEIAHRAREAGAAGILGAPGDRFDAVCVNALPPSVKIIATFIVGFDHIDIAAAASWCRTRRRCSPSPRPNAPSP